MKAFYEKMDGQTRAFPCENITFSEHLHKETEIILIEEGELQVQIGQECRRLRSGDVGIVFPNTIHSYETDTYSRSILLIFENSLAGDYEKILTRYRCLTPFPDQTGVLSDVHMCMKRFRSQDIREDWTLMKGYVTVLLGNLLPALQLGIKERHQEYRLMDEVLHYILEHYQEPVSLERIAAEVGVGKYTVSRVFSHEIQCGFNEYVNALRTGHAQHLLSNMEMSVTDIAYEAGFTSQRTFNRVFRELHGVSPRAYRQRIRQ